MIDFPYYLTEEQKEFWSNLDELQIVDYPKSQIYSVTFSPFKNEQTFNVVLRCRYNDDCKWLYVGVNEDGTRHNSPYVISKLKEVPFSIEDILSIRGNWFRAKGGGITFYTLAWVNIQTLCVGLGGFEGISVSVLAENFEHSPDGKNWQPLTKTQ